MSLIILDQYKTGHMLQYKPGINQVYSYECARSNKVYSECVFFGLQYYLKEYLAKPITEADVELFIKTQNHIMGRIHPEVEKKIRALQKVGYWPLEIKAVPEGTILPTKNALITVENTHPDFYWCVGFVESLILKTWYSCLVATNSLQYRKILDKAHDKTEGLNSPGRDFLNLDFGYRSDSSEESAAISGAAHLLFWKASDNISALPFIWDYYGGNDKDSVFMVSANATEHSTVTSWTPEGELDCMKYMLDVYPTGILSVVSDSYDLWRVITEYLPQIKDKILNRDGKYVVRPDTGFPPDIICGDPNVDQSTPAGKGVVRLLDEIFGHTLNNKGYKVLNEKIGLIYGEAITLERYKDIFERLEKMGYSATNLVVGVGGLLRVGNRDTLGVALKATHVEINGEGVEIFKNPVTGSDKKSHKGYMKVVREHDGLIHTVDQVSREESNSGLLQPVFRNGRVLRSFTFDEVRQNARKGY